MNLDARLRVPESSRVSKLNLAHFRRAHPNVNGRAPPKYRAYLRVEPLENPDDKRGTSHSKCSCFGHLAA